MSQQGQKPTRDWNESYRQGDTPWDSGIRSLELARVLDEDRVKPGRAVELGCGTGTNAVYLAQVGFEVTGIDLAPTAISEAQQKAEQANVDVRLFVADVCRLETDLGRFDFLFDRGCYHCVRRLDLPGFIETLRRLSRPGSQYLALAGNANEQSDEGPPRVHEHEIRCELGGLFEFDFIREMHFEDAGGIEGPLGWSCLMTRRSET